MRTRRLIGVLVLVLCAIGAAARGVAQDAAQYAGTWSGTWDGSGSGDFQLTLEKSGSGPLSGKVDVTTDAGPYTAALTAVAFDGKKMTAKYDFPLDAAAEVVLAATFEDKSAKGTWSLRPKGQPDEIVAGTWTVAKK